MTFVTDARSNKVDVRIERGDGSLWLLKSFSCAYPYARSSSTLPSTAISICAPGISPCWTAAVTTESAEATADASLDAREDSCVQATPARLTSAPAVSTAMRVQGCNGCRRVTASL